MLGKAKIWLLIMLLVGHTCSLTLLVLTFQSQRSYIATYLCQYKNIQFNNCQGRCYLNSSIEKLKQNHQSNPKVNIELSDSYVLFKELVLSKPVIYKLPNPSWCLSTIGYQLRADNRVYPPPQLCYYLDI